MWRNNLPSILEKVITVPTHFVNCGQSLQHRAERMSILGGKERRREEEIRNERVNERKREEKWKLGIETILCLHG